LRATEQKSGQAIFNINAILEGIERIDEMLGDGSHRSYAVKVLDHLQPFVASRRSDLAAGERTALQFWLLKVTKSLAALPDDFKATSGSESVRKRVEAAAAMFVD
jgi:hypothetical protein